MNQKTFEIGTRILVSTFPDRNIDMETYWELLKDMDDKRFLLAVKDLCSTTTELYPNTNLVAIIREKGMSRERLTAGEAWSEVMKQVSATGSYGTPTFENPLVTRAVDCIGWKAICMSTMISVERSHFFKIFDQLKEREQKEKILLPDVKNGFKELLGTVVKSIGVSKDIEAEGFK
uniref:Uncharacterized protein n=1 Tax=viral metagenome TaxID=1070528 RepID=A0A6M3L296_9ZZZZ